MRTNIFLIDVEHFIFQYGIDKDKAYFILNEIDFFIWNILFLCFSNFFEVLLLFVLFFLKISIWP